MPLIKILKFFYLTLIKHKEKEKYKIVFLHSFNSECEQKNIIPTKKIFTYGLFDNQINHMKPKITLKVSINTSDKK